jgi:hypothetical protein
MRNTMEHRFDAEPIVFIAEIRSIEDIRPMDAEFDPDADYDVGVDYGVRIGFRVLAPLKGDPAQVSTLYAGYGGGDCGLGAKPLDVVLVGTDASGSISICGLAMPFHVSSCEDVHLLDRLRRRGQDGKTELNWSGLGEKAVGEYDEVFDDVIEELIEQRRSPYDLRPDECPVQPDANSAD